MVHATTLTVLSKGFVGSLGAGQRGEKTPGSGGRRIQVNNSRLPNAEFTAEVVQVWDDGRNGKMVQARLCLLGSISRSKNSAKKSQFFDPEVEGAVRSLTKETIQPFVLEAIPAGSVRTMWNMMPVEKGTSYKLWPFMTERFGGIEPGSTFSWGGFFKTEDVALRVLPCTA